MKLFQVFIFVIHQYFIQADNFLHFNTKRETSVDPSTLDTNSVSVQNGIVDYMNQIRVNQDGSNLCHLSWDSTLAAEAAKNANNCPNQIHTPDNQRIYQGQPYGQNLAGSTNGCLAWKAIIDQWAAEKQNLTLNDPSKQTGHYTQLVWAQTNKVGCAVKSCPGPPGSSAPSCLYACNFFPAGNIVPCQTKPFVPGTPCSNTKYCTGNQCHPTTKLCTNPCTFPRDEAGNCKDFLSSCNVSPFKEQCQSSCNCKDTIFYQGC